MVDEEWSRWRLIMSADCSISYTEAFAMDDFEVNVANAALDKVIKMQNKATKKSNPSSKKKGGRR